MDVNSCRPGSACWRRSRKAAATLIKCVMSSRSLAEGGRVSSKRATESRSAYSASKRWGNAPGSDEGLSLNGEAGVTGYVISETKDLFVLYSELMWRGRTWCSTRRKITFITIRIVPTEIDVFAPAPYRRVIMRIRSTRLCFIERVDDRDGSGDTRSVGEIYQDAGRWLAFHK